MKSIQKLVYNLFFLTGAEPSEGFNFNIAMHGDVEEEIEGTELAAEFTFSSLQKFGQEFLMKLRGKKMPNPLLKKVRIIIFTHNKKKLNKVKKKQSLQAFFCHVGL